MTTETPKRSDAAPPPPDAGPAWLLWLLPLLLCLPCLLVTVGGVAAGVAVLVGALTQHAALALALGAVALVIGLGGAILLVRRRATRLCGDTCLPTAGVRRPAPDR